MDLRIDPIDSNCRIILVTNGSNIGYYQEYVNLYICKRLIWTHKLMYEIGIFVVTE